MTPRIHLNALQQQLLSDVQENQEKKTRTVTVNGMKANSNVCPFIPTCCLQKFAFPSSIIEKKKELRRREFENLPCFITEALYFVHEL